MHWSAIQLAVALLCACLPTYKSIFSNGVFFPPRVVSWYASLKGKMSRGSSQANTLEYDRSEQNSRYNYIGGKRDHNQVTTTIGGRQDDWKEADTIPLNGISVERAVHVN